MMQQNAIRLSIGVLFLLVFVAGCKQSSTVNGRVTCDGEPLAKGNISFAPADGRGPIVGGVITDGRYRLAIEPGMKKVQISGSRTIKFDKNNPMAARLSKHGDGVGSFSAIDPTITNAEGNQTTVEIKSGNQTIDFALKHVAAQEH